MLFLHLILGKNTLRPHACLGIFFEEVGYFGSRNLEFLKQKVVVVKKKSVDIGIYETGNKSLYLPLTVMLTWTN